MTSILELGTYRPRQVLLADRQEELGITDVELRRYQRAFGFESISVDPDVPECELIVRAVRALPSFEENRRRIKFVLRPRTVRFPSPYPLSPLHDAVGVLGLEHAETFALTEHACASGLLALDMAGALLATTDDPDDLALVVTGEKTYGRVGQIIPGIAVLGEASVAVLVAADGAVVRGAAGTGDGGGRDRLLGYSAVTEPIPGSGLTMDDAAMAVFGGMYSAKINAVIAGALDAAGITAADLRAFLPHNVNRMVGIRAARNLGLTDAQVVMDDLPRTAHCFSADNFLNLQSAVARDVLQPGDHYLMTSVGLGATFAAAVLQH